MMDTIRSLTKDDAPVVVGLQHQSTGAPWTLEVAYKILEDTAMKGWCIQTDDTILGFILIQKNGESADIVEFVVEESYRHQGLGKKLYNVMENDCVHDGLREIFLEVSELNVLGHLFYQKQNFKAIGLRKDYYSSSQRKADAILMRKQLE